MTACNWKLLFFSPSRHPRLLGYKARRQGLDIVPRKHLPKRRAPPNRVAGTSSQAANPRVFLSTIIGRQRSQWRGGRHDHPRRRPRTGRSSFLLPHRHWGRCRVRGSILLLRFHVDFQSTKNLAYRLGHQPLPGLSRRVQPEDQGRAYLRLQAAGCCSSRHHAAPPPRPPMSSSSPRSVTPSCPVARHASPPTTVSALMGLPSDLFPAFLGSRRGTLIHRVHQGHHQGPASSMSSPPAGITHAQYDRPYPRPNMASCVRPRRSLAGINTSSPAHRRPHLCLGHPHLQGQSLG
jgi:hypothetical protein